MLSVIPESQRVFVFVKAGDVAHGNGPLGIRACGLKQAAIETSALPPRAAPAESIDDRRCRESGSRAMSTLRLTRQCESLPRLFVVGARSDFDRFLSSQ